MKPKEKDADLSIIEVTEGGLELYLIGKSPLIINRLAEKAKHELLLPKGKKTTAEKASNLKHDPLAEFRSSAYIIPDETAQTYLAMPSTAPKRAMASAALDIPGAKKAQIGRLCYVQGDLIGVYGVPKMLMSIVRSADMNKTPDVRTRCIIPEWAMKLKITYVVPIIKPQIVLNLNVAAGLYIGIGDWRPEKGAGSFGQYFPQAVAKAESMEQVQKILLAGRKVQKQAMLNPEFYNDETKELFGWFSDTVKERGFTAAA